MWHFKKFLGLITQLLTLKITFFRVEQTYIEKAKRTLMDEFSLGKSRRRQNYYIIYRLLLEESGSSSRHCSSWLLVKKKTEIEHLRGVKKKRSEIYSKEILSKNKRDQRACFRRNCRRKTLDWLLLNFSPAKQPRILCRKLTDFNKIIFF